MYAECVLRKKCVYYFKKIIPLNFSQKFFQIFHESVLVPPAQG